jgi:hypothetical protein
VLFVLHKDKVPNLKPTRALFRVIGGTRRTTGELSAAIKVNLRTWAARSGLGHAPEVGIVTLLYVPPASEAFRGEANLVPPDRRCLFVIGIDRRGKPVGWDAELYRQELPRPVDRVALEVIAERPAPEHLKEGVVPRRAPDLLKVIVFPRHSKAALIVDRPGIRARLRATKQLFELHHPRIREEEGGISCREKRGARHCGVPASLKKGDESRPQFGGAI